MISSQTTPSPPLTDAQIAQILSQLEQLVRLVGPLMALLSGASGMAGGAGQRLEELIQQLTSVSAGLQANAEALTQVFGPEGTLMRMDQRLQAIETAIGEAARMQAETARQVRQIGRWLTAST